MSAPLPRARLPLLQTRAVRAPEPHLTVMQPHLQGFYLHLIGSIAAFKDFFIFSFPQVHECTVHLSGSSITATRGALPLCGLWVSCYMTWCVGTSHSSTTRRSPGVRFCFGGESLQVSSPLLTPPARLHRRRCGITQRFPLYSSRMPAPHQMVSESATD